MKKYTLKHTALPISIFFIIIISLYFYYFYQIKKYGKYSIATTTHHSVSKGYSTEYYYEFFVNGEIRKGNLSDFVLNRLKNKIICPGGKYLVIYSSNNPGINILVDEKPANEYIDLDSLNLIGVDENDWSWTDL